MILLLIALAIPVTVLLSVLTAGAVAIRGFTAPTRSIVGDPPPGIGARTVKISCGAGHALAGWFAPGRPGRGAMLLLHGPHADRRALASRMAMLACAGSAVLAVDLRAHGESGGRAVTFGHREAEDVAAALAWLRAAAPGERVGGLGISLGGAALALASRTAPLDAMVLESVFPTLDGAIRNRLRLVAGTAAEWIAPVLAAIGTGLTGLRAADLRPIEALRRYPGPVLVVSGSLDALTTPSETRALYAAAPGRKELWMVEGAGHVDMAAAAGSDYDRRVLAFLGLHLEQNTPCA